MDLPLPDLPTMATNSLGLSRSVTLLSAGKCACWRFVAFADIAHDDARGMLIGS